MALSVLTKTQEMTPLTALDLARIKVRRMGDTNHTFDCPSCGGLAWAGRVHLQCMSKECGHKVFAPLDLLQVVWKATHVECAETAAAMIGRQPDRAGASARLQARTVLDAWFQLCRNQRTSTEILLSNAYGRAGYDATNLGFGAAVVDKAKLQEFIQLAVSTGATVPDRWLEEPPEKALLYCIQSAPHTIDRIVVVYGRDFASDDIVWHKRRAGFSGLLDAGPGYMQFLVADKLAAMRLQHRLRRTGHLPQVISTFYDPYAEFTDGGWLPDDLNITAVISGNDSLVEIQRAIDQYPGMEDALYGTTEASLLSLTPDGDTVPWSFLRLATILRLTPPGSKRISIPAASLFERTGSRPDDASTLVALYRKTGAVSLAEDMRRLAENHVIYQDNLCKVRETYNSYRIFSRHEERDVANFSLRLKASVIFSDANSDVYYQGVVGHGNKKTEALISRTALESVKHLQQELQVVAADGDGVIPTVIDLGHMRGKVMPYLAAQAARVPVIRGIHALGWSADRKVFQAAGVTVDLDGARIMPAVFHPAVQPLRPFKGVAEWSDACPEIPQDAQTLVAMMLALTVRSYKRCTVRPIKVVQTSDAITLLQGIMASMGQQHILELNSNARDARLQNTGVLGYPCVAAGFTNQQINQSTTTYTILTDEGFRITDEITIQDAEAAGRAAQFALIRLVEWCIATQADAFREMPSTDWHNSLMREGKWLMEHVCQLQPWEVRIKEVSDLEHVFNQIPLDQIHERMVLINGTTLRVDCSGLEVNIDGVIRECGTIGADCHLKDKALLIPAAPIIASVHRFYGCDPGIKAVLS